MPLIKYSALRLLLLLVCVAVLQFVLGGWLLLLTAVILAALISYLALGRFRDASALYLANASQRRASGINSPGTDDEDEDREADAAARDADAGDRQSHAAQTDDQDD